MPPKTALYRAYEKDDAFDRLRTLMHSKRPPIAVIGAGASAKSGYPTWLELLQRLKDAANKNKNAKAVQWKRNIEDISDAPWTAELFAQELGTGGLGKLIKAEFASKGTLPAEPHPSIAKMPFPHFLTTNFDPCIEEALKAERKDFLPVSWCEDQKISEFLINLNNPETKTRVVYLHGRHNDNESDIILTERAYVSRYIASDDARRKLMAVFMTHPVVFIGFSMNDPDLANLMREVTARLRTNPPSHFAIMSYKTETDREATRARMVGKFGVRPVFFSVRPTAPGGDDYSNLVPLLGALSGKQMKVTEKDWRRSQPAEFDPEDPHKGRFSGLDEHNGRRLIVKKTGGSKAEEYLELMLMVEPTNHKPIRGKVKFYLHPTFDIKVKTVEATDGAARCGIESYGAFTVGAEIMDEKKRYEVDLATLPDLPLWFRQQ